MSAIRIAQSADLQEIVAIYNAATPGRMAAAHTEPVTVAARLPWFNEFEPARCPLWVLTDEANRIRGWLSLRSFYGRPAYAGTVEAGVHTAPGTLRRGIVKTLLAHALASAPALGIQTLLALVFAHNAPSIGLFESAGFAPWGQLRRVARLDGVERDLATLGRKLP